MRLLLAGATGLVGSGLALLADGHELVAIGRRPVARAAANLTGEVQDWPALIAKQRFDAMISTVGTTIKQAGSQAAFAAIDRDAVVALAKAARAGRCPRVLMVSSVGANARSSNFYLRTKGEAEEAVQALGFNRVDIFRPGLLRGERQGPPRIGERLAALASPVTDLLTPAVLDQYRSIAAADVARAIAALLREAEPGVFVHHNRDMLLAGARIA